MSVIFLLRRILPGVMLIFAEKIMDLTQQQWAEKFSQDDNALILDVRTPHEWEEGIIPGAILIDIHQPQEFLEGIEALDKAKNYYVYCKAGGRSHQACMIMNQLGIANTYNLLGGMMQWQGDVVEHQ
jgi:rhodanese-related sulfurtransferase